MNKTLLTIILLFIISSAFLPLYFNEVSGGTFPGINGKIAFNSGFGDTEIWTMNPDGSGRTQLTSTMEEANPDFSADGKKIVFRSSRDGPGIFEIYIMNADGSGETRITMNDDSDFGPSFSPDGQKIAFFSDSDGDQEIYTMNIGGTGLNQLTNNNIDGDKNPQWSPDGTKIVYESIIDSVDDPNISSRDVEIWVMNSADGSGQTNLSNRHGTLLDPLVDVQPSWSPDGSKIVWSGDINDQREIWIMNSADGSGQTQLTDDPLRIEEANPSFSPEGDKIAYCSIKDRDTFKIFVMNPDGNDVKNISLPLGAFDCSPDWGAAMIMVGGKILPIDSTSLLLAGTFSTVAWIIPVIVAAAGFGIVIARKF